MAENKEIKLSITSSWDGKPVGHDPYEFMISADLSSIKVDVRGPFFNDPGCPSSPPGEPCDELWEYEVAEIFFLGQNDRYLEVEFCPHGQHIVLLLDGQRNLFKDKLPLEYTSRIDTVNQTWTGSAVIPISYFPPDVQKVNAFAIHGSGTGRQYEALYPFSNEFSTPDFHRLQFFKEFNFKSLFPSDWKQPPSILWSERVIKT